MTFRFYIINPIDGTVTGTDSEELAMNYTKSVDYIVIEPATNSRYMLETTKSSIEDDYAFWADSNWECKIN